MKISASSSTQEPCNGTKHSLSPGNLATTLPMLLAMPTAFVEKTTEKLPHALIWMTTIVDAGLLKFFSITMRHALSGRTI